MFIAKLFNSLKDISFQTEILEKCDWDEEKADLFIHGLSGCLVSFTESERFNIDDFLNYLKNNIDDDLYISVEGYLKDWIETHRYLEESYEA